MVRHGVLLVAVVVALCVSIIIDSHVTWLPNLRAAITRAWPMFIFLRSSNSSRSIYNNAWILKRHALHSTPVAHLRASSFQKFHATNVFSATFRDAIRHAPRGPWRPAGPFQRFRRRFDNIPSDFLLYGILGVNGAVFAAWSYVHIFQVRPPSPSCLCPHNSRGTGLVIQATQRQVAR
jgi:hypothetical protein